MLVGDDWLGLQHLQDLLEPCEEMAVVGAFQDPVQAFDQAAVLQPDAVFLEMHMAEQMQTLCPNAEIVIVTGDDQHALRAFELGALDYLLKPVRQDRLALTVDRLCKRRGKQVQRRSSSGETTRVLCFQSIRFQRAGLLPQVPKWRTAKAQELFAYLLHRRGELVRKGTLMELLWPELDEKRAMTQLYSSIYQIRQCLAKLEIEITIRNSSIREGYVLDAANVRVDTEDWERALAQHEGRWEDRMQELGRLLALYEGDYLHDHVYLWAENERERLRRLWLQHARLLARLYLATDGKQAEAAELYERIQEVDPYDEAEGLTLLQLYDESGRTQKVQDCYRRLRHAFTQELGLRLPDAVVEWYARWSAGRHNRR